MQEEKEFVMREVIGIDPITNTTIFKEVTYPNYSEIELEFKFLENIVLNLPSIKKVALNAAEAFKWRFNFRLSLAKDEKDALEFIQEELSKAHEKVSNPMATWVVHLHQQENPQALLDQLHSELGEVPGKEFSEMIAVIFPEINDLKGDRGFKELWKTFMMNLDYFLEEHKSTCQSLLSWYLYHEYLLGLYKEKTQNSDKENNNKLEESPAGKDGPKKKLTVSQKVLATMLINKFHRFSFGQDKKVLQDLIVALTDQGYRSVGDAMKVITDNKFSRTQETPLQSMKDFEAIRPLFERFDNEEILAFIDGKIKQLRLNSEE
jgi:hypothetical protein